MTYGEKLRQWREAKGLSREEIAVALGCSAATIRYRETQSWEPSLNDLRELEGRWPGALTAIAGKGAA